jgi:putative restriction endonuclease
MNTPIYIGVTDTDWYRFHLNASSTEVNFWRPGSGSFKVLDYGQPFVFKLKSPVNKIVGFGFFAGYHRLPVSMAWYVFGKGNGTPDVAALRSRLSHMADRNNIGAVSAQADPEIGCIALSDCVFLPEQLALDAPSDWKPNIVSGKTYGSDQGFNEVMWHWIRANKPEADMVRDPIDITDIEPDVVPAQFGDAYLTRGRLGQSGFRLQILKNYENTCVFTGEHTLPVLQAAHIRPVSTFRNNAITNGILLRADVHILYDQGLVGIDQDYKLRVSPAIREQYLNGVNYYAHDSQSVRKLPDIPTHRPNRDHLAWHMENVFVK